MAEELKSCKLFFLQKIENIWQQAVNQFTKIITKKFKSPTGVFIIWLSALYSLLSSIAMQFK